MQFPFIGIFPYLLHHGGMIINTYQGGRIKSEELLVTNVSAYGLYHSTSTLAHRWVVLSLAAASLRCLNFFVELVKFGLLLTLFLLLIIVFKKFVLNY